MRSPPDIGNHQPAPLDAPKRLRRVEHGANTLPRILHDRRRDYRISTPFVSAIKHHAQKVSSRYNLRAVHLGAQSRLEDVLGWGIVLVPHEAGNGFNHRFKVCDHRVDVWEPCELVCSFKLVLWEKEGLLVAELLVGWL